MHLFHSAPELYPSYQLHIHPLKTIYSSNAPAHIAKRNNAKINTNIKAIIPAFSLQPKNKIPYINIKTTIPHIKNQIQCVIHVSPKKTIIIKIVTIKLNNPIITTSKYNTLFLSPLHSASKLFRYVYYLNIIFSLLIVIII